MRFDFLDSFLDEQNNLYSQSYNKYIHTFLNFRCVFSVVFQSNLNFLGRWIMDRLLDWVCLMVYVHLESMSLAHVETSLFPVIGLRPLSWKGSLSCHILVCIDKGPCGPYHLVAFYDSHEVSYNYPFLTWIHTNLVYDISFKAYDFPRWKSKNIFP